MNLVLDLDIEGAFVLDLDITIGLLTWSGYGICPYWLG